MSTNSNYTPSAGRSFSSEIYYQAESLGPFNAVAGHSSFAAYCTFILRGGIQDIAANMVEQVLWGNLNVADQRGWEISLIGGSGNTLFLAARIGTGADIVNAAVLITGTQADGIITPIERLVMAGLWYDGTTLYLSINGVLAAYDASAAPSPSNLLARIGAGHAAVAADPAINVDIVSVGYFNEADFDGGGGGIGEFASDAFSASRANSGMSAYLRPISAIDWTHRYDFAASTGATIIKQPDGSALSSFGLAPATLEDLGGQGLSNPDRETNTAAPLTRVGAVHAFTRKNADWYAGGAFLTAQGG
jgi:hypothetical protein